MDKLTVKERSKNMAAVKAKNTKPEILVRKLLFHIGFRYRLNSSKLPGKPDVILKRYKTVIFINGCFWHQHQGCKDSHYPKTKLDFWIPKLEGNVKRDNLNYQKLSEMGYRVLIIWECELKIKKGILVNTQEISLKLAHIKQYT
jgi:DNA mismatch endonuclease (patch repair protein)